MEYLISLALAVAVVFDLRERRIPNSLVIIILVFGCIYQIKALGLIEGGLALSLGGAIGLVALMPGYLLHAVGGGDVKLMAAVGVCTGGWEALTAVVVVYLVGLVVGFGVMLAGRAAVTIQSFENVPYLGSLAKAAAFPYAPVIAVGGILTIFGVV